MSTPTGLLTALHTSTAEMLQGLAAEQWGDDDLRAPSLLPGWTRGHVLAHIARNADGITRTLSGALRGQRVPRYPGGRSGRNADIEVGSTRGFAELAADVRESADRLGRLFAAVADADGWDLPTEDRPARDYVQARWREVEIHRVDLAGGYTAEQWSAEFVAYVLPELIGSLDARRAPPLRIEVTADGSVTSGLGGTVWTVGGAHPIHVAGPDWALAAWLAGRHAASGTLIDAPEVSAWL